MNFFFTISYRTVVGRTFFGSRKVSLQIDWVTLVSEIGASLSLHDETIKSLRKKIADFVEAEKTAADRIGEKVVFIGYNCGIEVLLLQQLITGDFVDMAQEYNELANAMSDEDFGLDSEYTIQKGKLPSHKYSLADKLEMIHSHPEFPQSKGIWGDMLRCEWMRDVYNFDLFKLHLMRRGFHEGVNYLHDIINNEK